MLNASPAQFRLTDEGLILFQPHPTNPLPGTPVAKIRKGRAALAPESELIDSEYMNGQNRAAAKEFLNAWLKSRIKEVLGPLVELENMDELPGPVRGICFQLFEAMGIVPRENLEDLIAGLDTEMRQALRAKQVRLGPVLVFLPALNKPAAVRLRGLLWSLWNDRPLPAGVPADGVVSLKIEPQDADRRFYQAIGYPVYGPRAIRIDMLDRVINAVYDSAKEGKFRADHKMAEWLGCSIDDLYAVLESMGHRRIDEPVPPAQETAEAAPEAAPATEAVAEPAAVEKPAQEKPVLATFRLKKGKASEPARSVRPAFDKKPVPKKDFRKDKKPDGKKFDKKQDGPKIITAAAPGKASDSPFAILEQLKVKKDASGS